MGGSPEWRQRAAMMLEQHGLEPSFGKSVVCPMLLVGRQHRYGGQCVCAEKELEFAFAPHGVRRTLWKEQGTKVKVIVLELDEPRVLADTERERLTSRMAQLNIAVEQHEDGIITLRLKAQPNREA